jgi:Transposase DDE domain
MARRRPVVLKRDHARPRTPPAPTNEAIDAHLTALIQPAVFAQHDAYRRLGLRERVLALPAMVAIVLTIVWRQVPAVGEAVRLLEREGVLWTPAGVRVSQQALSLRLRSLPEALFAGIWTSLAPALHARAAARTRPLPPVIARIHAHYPRIWAIDGSTLEELFKKVGLLRPATGTVLGGTIAAVLDVATKLPVHLWLEPDPVGNDLRFLDRVKGVLTPGTLVVMDAAYWAFPFFDWLTDHGCGFVIRARTVRAETVVRVLHASPSVRDRIVKLGLYRSNPCTHPVRIIEVKIGTSWRPYLTNVLDPRVLSVADVVELYGRRWKIEEAFLVTKRLLGLSYLWSGAYNAIALQVWASWLLYAVLVDLSDAVAEDLGQPLDAMSLEMTFRGLYHYTSAFHRGATGLDPVAWLAAQDDLGLVKRRRKSRERQRATLDTWRQELNL